MDPNNPSCVYVVMNDNRKDLTDAERYGQLKDVFSSVGRVYNTPRMIEHARRVLSKWKDGDSLLVIGDPTLCGVCMSIVLENHDHIDILRWDRDNMQYVKQAWDFGVYDEIDDNLRSSI